jgi:hypothetical protein
MGLVMRPRWGLLRLAAGSAVFGSPGTRRARAEQERINDQAQAVFEATRGAAAPPDTSESDRNARLHGEDDARAAAEAPSPGT